MNRISITQFRACSQEEWPQFPFVVTLYGKIIALVQDPGEDPGENPELLGYLRDVPKVKTIDPVDEFYNLSPYSRYLKSLVVITAGELPPLKEFKKVLLKETEASTKELLALYKKILADPRND